MLGELLEELITALKSGDRRSIENAYEQLEEVGMDRWTAKIVVSQLMHERKSRR